MNALRLLSIMGVNTVAGVARCRAHQRDWRYLCDRVIPIKGQSGEQHQTMLNIWNECLWDTSWDISSKDRSTFILSIVLLLFRTGECEGTRELGCVGRRGSSTSMQVIVN